MKTNRSKTALRVLVASIVLLSAASQGNEAEAFCDFKVGGTTYRCWGTEGSCHFDFGESSLVCDGTEIAVLAEKQLNLMD